MNPDCDDGDPCTSDVCLDGACVNSPIAGCCVADNECNDGNLCTADSCVGNTCQIEAINGCCVGNADCDDGSACTVDSCVGNACNFAPIAGCCEEHADCDDGDACTLDACGANNVCSTVNIPNCCQDNADCADGNICTDDICGLDGQCTNPLKLDCCDVDADCDDGNSCTADSCLSGGGFSLCQNEPAPGPGCCQADNDCPDAPCETESCGADFQCNSEPDPDCCIVDSDCDDSDACSLDKCVNGNCVNIPNGVPGCCKNDAECDDGAACTTDACVDGQCTNVTNELCDDGNDCTSDTCVNGACLNTLQAGAGCCLVDTDCNDGNHCTQDICNSDGECEFPATGPLPGVEEICVNAIDDDCNPSTLCWVAFMGANSTAIEPIKTDTGVVDFYGYNEATNSFSANTGFEQSNAITILVHEDQDQNSSIVWINDLLSDGSGGSTEVDVAGAVGLQMIVKDDNDGTDDFAFNSTTGEGNFDWSWGGCCTDGAVLGFVDEPMCIEFTFTDLNNMNAVNVWPSQVAPFNLGVPGLGDTVTICATE